MTQTLDEQIRQATTHICRRLNRQPRDLFSGDNCFAPPDQGQNHTVIAAVCALLSAADDLQGFVLEPDLLTEFDLRSAYGIDPRPLFHLNALDRKLTHRVRALFARDDNPLDHCFPSVLDHLRQIRDRRLLGEQTAGKLAFVRDIMYEPISRLTVEEVTSRLATIHALAEPLRVFEFRELARQIIKLRNTSLELLARQRSRLVPGHSKCSDVEQMQSQLLEGMCLNDVLFLELDQLSRDDPRTAFGFDDFCASYCDEIVQIFARHADEPSSQPMSESWRCVRGQGIEVAYAPRNVHFLQLGDVFGDCTARRANKQVDQQIANIHWTVYAWLLDPFYRVLLVHVNGEPVLKAHLTPLIIHDEPVLAVDAIEVVPSLRNIVNGRAHRFLSTRLFAQRTDILQAAFDTAIDLAVRMGIGRVMVDKYSNAEWVRQAVDALPEEAYHILEVEKPFGSRPVKAIINRWFSMGDIHLQSELQHVNPGLMDQGLYPGCKQAGLLLGNPCSRGIFLRGP